MTIYFLLAAIVLIYPTLGQIIVQPNCDYFQFLAVGQKYFIYNAGYPNNYPPNTNCRWIAKAPEGYRIRLTCSDINIPTSINCANERLAVSLTGSGTFLDGQNYCGSGTLTLTSVKTSMSIGLFTTPLLAKGGRFSCEIYTIVDTTIPVITPKPPTCDCGWRQQRRIVGGTQTGVNEYPFAAALINLLERRLFCGATIIHYHYAITAAHCLQRISVPSSIALLVGDHDINSGTETTRAALYPLLSFITHASYSAITKQHDIAIVRTAMDITFSLSVGPACLPFKWTNSNPPVPSPPNSVTLLGWGTTEYTGPPSNVLLSVIVPVVTNLFCQQEHSTLTNPSQIFPTQICTMGQDKDACQSDSGGPVVFMDTASIRLFLVGVISYGVGCGLEIPSVNTRITSYMQWILTNTQDATYCIK